MCSMSNLDIITWRKPLTIPARTVTSVTYIYMINAGHVQESMMTMMIHDVRVCGQGCIEHITSSAGRSYLAVIFEYPLN